MKSTAMRNVKPWSKLEVATDAVVVRAEIVAVQADQVSVGPTRARPQVD